MVLRRTMRKRLSRSLKQIKEWCRENRHRAIGEQRKVLDWKLRGHYAYYGIHGNYAGLDRFVRAVRRIWHKWLSRRSNSGLILWADFQRLLKRYPLPAPRLIRRPTQLSLSETLR